MHIFVKSFKLLKMLMDMIVVIIATYKMLQTLLSCYISSIPARGKIYSINLVIFPFDLSILHGRTGNNILTMMQVITSTQQPDEHTIIGIPGFDNIFCQDKCDTSHFCLKCWVSRSHSILKPLLQ